MSENSPLTVSTRFELDRDPSAPLLDALAADVAAGRRAAGNLDYRMFQDRERAACVVLFERWASSDARAAHRAGPAHLAVRDALGAATARITELEELAQDREAA